MSPTILVIGATGNTGRSVVSTLSKLISDGSYNIVALTRSLESDASKQLAALFNVKVVEKDWTDLTAAWLKENNVEKVFIAPYGGPTQFTDESGLHLALLDAKVRYVVRISTNDAAIAPSSHNFTGRNHWAIENLLSQPEFKPLRWTSLRPNFFSVNLLQSEAEWINTYRRTGEIGHLNLAIDKNAKVGIIDPHDVGVLAANLLVLDNDAAEKHNNKRYTVSGPEDYTGAKVLSLVERLAGVKIPQEKVTFRYMGWLDELAKAAQVPLKLLPSADYFSLSLWSGRSSLSNTPTDSAVLELLPPMTGMEAALRKMLE